MKKIILSFIVICCCFTVMAQTASIDSTSTNIIVYPNNFKLYKTNNIFTFLKLDTRNGRIWQVQYNVEDSKRFETTLNFRSLVYDSEKDEIPGRFELHPTTNTYIFIMLDKVDGRSWQVQWNIDRNKRFVDFIQ